MKETKKWTKWLYWFTFAVAVIVVYKVLDNFGDITSWFNGLISILTPFFMGILIAYLLYIPCKKIEKAYENNRVLRKRARGLAVITVYIMAFLILFIIINIILPSISKSVIDLANNLPSYYSNAMNYIQNLPDDSLLNKESIQEIIIGLEKIDITKFLNLENIYDYIKGAFGIVSGIFSAFVTLIMSIYFLLERKDILKFIKKLNNAIFKEKTCEKIDMYFKKTNEIFFKFISSQILDAIIVGIIMSILLLILRVKYWLLLGFLIGLFNIIPYLGAIVGVTIAGIITLFTGGFSQALWMLIFAIIAQQIDANIINPRLVKNALKISPILVIFSITLFGAYYGILGMFLSVPIIATIKLLLNDWIDSRIEKNEK